MGSVQELAVSGSACCGGQDQQGKAQQGQGQECRGDQTATRKPSGTVKERDRRVQSTRRIVDRGVVATASTACSCARANGLRNGAFRRPRAGTAFGYAYSPESGLSWTALSLPAMQTLWLRRQGTSARMEWGNFDTFVQMHVVLLGRPVGRPCAELSAQRRTTAIHHSGALRRGIRDCRSRCQLRQLQPGARSGD